MKIIAVVSNDFFRTVSLIMTENNISDINRINAKIYSHSRRPKKSAITFQLNLLWIRWNVIVQIH